MQDDSTGLLMSYIFSYAIINELYHLHIYYIINFLKNQIQVNNRTSSHSTSGLDILGLVYQNLTTSFWRDYISQQ